MLKNKKNVVIGILIIFSLILIIIFAKIYYSSDYRRYEIYGIKYHILNEQFTYHGEKVRYLEDNKLGKKLGGAVYMQPTGKYDVIIRRNSSGEIKGADIYPVEETLDRIKELYESGGSGFFSSDFPVREE